MEEFDVLNENGEFTSKLQQEKNVILKVYGIEQFMRLYLTKMEMYYFKKEVTKKAWPNLWNVTAGGHVLAGEFGIDALKREVKEELGIEISNDEIHYLVGSTSTNIKGNIINNHFNECYIVTKDIDIKDINLQKEEVSDIKWFSKDDILKRIDNNYDEITEKVGPWNFLQSIMKS